MPSPRPFEDRERAREAGRKGAARTAELRRLKRDDPAEYLAQTLGASRSELTELLLDAAFGRRTFAATMAVKCDCGCEHEFDVLVPALPPDKRLGAVTKALEFAIGRPATQKATGATEPEAKPEPGLVIE